MTTVLVTGASRGLGIEFVKQYSKAGADVIACCRKPDDADELQSLVDGSGGSIRSLKHDATDFEGIGTLADNLKGEKIDILINNAGIGGPRGEGADAQNFKGWNEVFETNVYGPLKTSLALQDHVAASDEKKIVTISSGLGSIAAARGGGGGYAYNISKAAVNRAMKQLSLELAPKGIIVAALAPGWVRTDMGGPNAMYSPEESISGMRTVIAGLTTEKSGSFISHTGEIVPW